MTILKIHVLQLENEKWFLHVSQDLSTELLFIECALLYDFVKNNVPKKLAATIDISDALEINLHVKRYMRIHGIDNVRGGNYTDEILPDYIIKTIELELSSGFSEYDKKTELFEQILQTYIYKFYISNSTFDFENEISFIDREYKKYMEIKKTYNQFLSKVNYRDLIKDIEWIREKLIVTFPIRKYKIGIPYSLSEDIKQYRTFLKNFDILYEKYYLLNEDKITIFPDAILKKPYLLLDYLFLHPRLISNSEDYQLLVTSLINKIENMAYVLINFFDEIKFDYEQFNKNMEDKTRFSLVILDYCKGINRFQNVKDDAVISGVLL